MFDHLRPRLTFANVASSLALFVALGSGAYAATQLPKNSVGSEQIKRSAVRTGDIARNAVKVGKLDKEAVKAGKLAKNAVPTNRLRNNAVTLAKLRDGVVNSAKVADGSLTGGDIDQGSLNNVRAANVIGISITGDATCSPALPLPPGVTSSGPGEGVCQINFSNPVNDCSANATVHLRPTKPILIKSADRTAQIFSEPGEPTVLIVVTYLEELKAAQPFDLVLVC
jgi:hypothetical protein